MRVRTLVIRLRVREQLQVQAWMRAPTRSMEPPNSPQRRSRRPRAATGQERLAEAMGSKRLFPAACRRVPDPSRQHRSARERRS